MPDKIFLTHSSLITARHRADLDVEVEERSCDKVHTVYNFDEPITFDFLRRVRKWRHATFAHLLMQCVIWKEPTVMSDCKRADELCAVLTQDYQYVNSIINYIKKYPRWFKVKDYRKIKLIVQICTNTQYYADATTILETYFVGNLLEETTSRKLQWCINEQGPVHENQSTYYLTVHITSNSIYTGLRLVDYQFFYPYLSQTSQYGSSSMAVAELTNITDGSIVLDLNAVVGELLLEVLLLKNCYCIGIAQELDDSEGALKNFEKFKSWRRGSKIPYFDIIAAEMKGFFNFYAVDHILARCPFRSTQPISEVQDYFNHFDSFLKNCRPNVTATLIYPKAPEYVTIVKEMFVERSHIRITKSCFFEEFHRKYGLIQLQTAPCFMMPL
ncbi:unnamed protein product [Caenorhabditis angaria]|uniref:Uncharacterized protein n=1 Tax=Caenorhabditis angaria TaxID=860376 RepID=A0A9P1IVR1_9PELO|nr:unnamed protein product [Caenorhabditis angaria]